MKTQHTQRFLKINDNEIKTECLSLQMFKYDSCYKPAFCRKTSFSNTEGRLIAGCLQLYFSSLYSITIPLMFLEYSVCAKHSAKPLDKQFIYIHDAYHEGGILFIPI